MTGSTNQGVRRDFFPDPVQEITSSGAQQCLTLWLLRLDRETPRLRFVYGNVLPSRSRREPGTWTSGEVVRWSGHSRLLRLTLHIDSTRCQQLLRTIEAGTPTDRALTEHGLGSPSIEESDLAGKVLQRLPTAFFSTADHLYALRPQLWPRTSPISSVSCTCARFVQTDRFSFLPADAIESERLLRAICAALKSETGLSFSTNAGDALGSLEVYRFPSLDLTEKPRVRTTYASPPSRALTVRINRDDEAAEYAIQVRTEQVRDVASDDLVGISKGSSEITLELPHPIDGVLVRVWKRLGDEHWTLWHEQDDHFLRSMRTQLTLGGLTGTIGASWLDRVSKRLAARIEKFEQIRQVSHAIPMEMSDREVWETTIQKARELVAQAHPPRSSSRFFQRGWGPNDSKFELAEWLKEKLSSHEQTIILTDPYFDVLGLDLVCRASGAAREIVVLTSTQIKSDDDEPSMSRSDRLKEAARRNLAVLGGIKLRICDLRSAKSESNSKPTFHDRYLLFLDKNDNPVEGYNLSTSLQSAATTSPLLATEIPADVLGDVADYVRSLMVAEPEMVLETLFPLPELKTRRHRPGLTDARAAAIIAAVEASGRDTSAGTAIERVKLLALYDDESQRVRLAFLDDELRKLSSFLASSAMIESAKVWNGMVAAALSGWHNGIPPLIQRLLAQGIQAEVTSFLLRFLEAHAMGEIPDDDDASRHTQTLAHMMELPFTSSIREAARMRDHHHILPLGTSWAIHVALIFLIRVGPDSIDVLLSTLRKRKAEAQTIFSSQHGPRHARPSKETITKAADVLGHVDAILSAASAALTWFIQPSGPGLPDAYHASTEPFARALWSVALLRKAKTGEVKPNDFITHVGRLVDLQEQRVVLAQLVYDFRVQGNHAISRSETPTPLPQWLKDAVVEKAASPSSVDEVVQLVEFYSGPLFGDWSPSTYQDLLQPIIKRGKLDDASVFDVWDRMLRKSMHDQYVSRSAFELVQVWGSSAWYQDIEQMSALIESMSHELDEAHQTLLEPFLSSRDHERWLKAVNGVLWTLLRAWAIVRARSEGNQNREAQDLSVRARDIAQNEHIVSQAIGELQQMVTFVLSEMRGS